MSLDTYSNLQTSIGKWLHRDGDSTLTTYIPDFITLAESKIWNRLRLRQQETTMSTVIASGVIAVPTNYVTLNNAYISSTSPYKPLERKTVDWLYSQYPDRTAAGTPAFIARETTNFIFGPYPDSNYTVTLVYYNRLAALSSAVNSVFTSYPGLWLYGALLEAAPYLKNDSRIPVWESKYKELMSIVQDESDDEVTSGGALSIHAA